MSSSCPVFRRQLGEPGFPGWALTCCLLVQSVGGNIITASPISDLNPVFMACGAKLTIVSRGELPHAEVRKEGLGAEKSHEICHVLEKQSAKFNDPAVLRLGFLEAIREMHPGWGPGKRGHFSTKTHNKP